MKLSIKLLAIGLLILAVAGAFMLRTQGRNVGSKSHGVTDVKQLQQELAKVKNDLVKNKIELRAAKAEVARYKEMLEGSRSFAGMSVSNASGDRTAIELYRMFLNRGMKPVPPGEADVNIQEWQKPHPLVMITDVNGGIRFKELIYSATYSCEFEKLMTNLAIEKQVRDETNKSKPQEVCAPYGAPS